jgi:hypothetical protein
MLESISSAITPGFPIATFLRVRDNANVIAKRHGGTPNETQDQLG